MESLHEEVGDDEVQFKEDDNRVGSPTPPIPITTIDMEVIIKGWEDKFQHLTRSLREVQLASEKANSDMFVGVYDDMTSTGKGARAGTSRSGAWKPCTWVSRSSCRNVNPRTSQLRAKSTLPRRARRTRSRRPQGYQPDCVRNLNSNHLQWVRTSPWNPLAARYRTSGITTTPGECAPGITTTFGTRASENTTPSGTRAPEIMTTFGTRASENMTPSGTRAPENTLTRGTHAPVNSTTIEIVSTNDLHTRMTGETAVTYSRIHIIVE